MTPRGNTSGSVKGFLDVKIPARKRRSISLFRQHVMKVSSPLQVQVWKRRCWVVVRGDRSPEDGAARTNQLSLSVEIYTRHEGSNHPTEGTILHLDLVHRIRRAKSKSHPYAFEVCGRRGEALLYLSGQSETETQRWMAEIRNILWPPTHLEAIRRAGAYIQDKVIDRYYTDTHVNTDLAHGSTWEVSAISVGDAGADWTSLAGLYGRLAVREANLVIKDTHNGTTRVEWPLTSVQRVCVATGGELEDEGKIFIVQTRQCHPCGEACLYFFSPELSALLEGLHEAVSELISASAADDVSLISDLSELSGALSSVVVLPPRLPDPPKMRKSTSVMDLAQIHELQPLCNVHTPPRLSSSQCNLAEEIRGEPPLPGRMLGHTRRRSMSETNLAKLCLDETDEELESRDDDLEDADLRQTDLPKDRTSSSGSYNSYRSTDSGVRLSASPSTHCDGGRYMSENATRRFVTKSDSLDSGVRACLKEDARDTTAEGDDSRKTDSPCTDGKQEGRRGMSALEEEPDVDTKVGAWCLQSARARKSFFAKNLNVTCAAHKDRQKVRQLNRTMSESYKEVVDKHDDYRRMSELPTMPKTCTVYEEIVDVLKPLNTANQQPKEHDYEELDKCRRDIKRSYSFQEKSKPPPLPPRRPKSFSPDPWAEEALSKSGTLKKIFGLSFQSKSHSTDSMLDVDTSGYDDMTTLGSADMALVQAIGTLPRVRKKVGPERQSSRSASPKMSPKQKARSLFGVSPSRSPMIPRPKNLFLFKGSGKDDTQISPHSKVPFRLHRQFSLQTQRTPSTDSSLADISAPDTPQQQQQQQQQQACGHRQYWRGDAGGQVSDAQSSGDDACGTMAGKDSYAFLKSPKLMTKTFSFLKKFPKEKSGSLERQRKSGINFMPPQEMVTKFPNSYSMDSFAVEKGSQSCGTPVRDTDADWAEADVVPGCRLRSMSYLPPASPAIRIPFHSHHDSTSTTPAGTPTGLSFSPLRKLSSPQPATEPLSWREEGGCWKECESRLMPGGHPLPPPREPPPPPAPHEPHYANLPHHSHDPDYMSMEEVRGAFRRISNASVAESRRDSGGYLSMGEIRSFQRQCEASDCPGCNVPMPSITHHDCQPERETHPEDHEYMTMDDIQSVLHTEFPAIYSSSDEKEMYKGCGFKSAPSSRKTSYSEGSDYLTPQEVGRMIRREVLAIRRGRESTVEHAPHHHQQHHYDPHHHQHEPHHHPQEPPQHKQYHHH